MNAFSSIIIIIVVIAYLFYKICKENQRQKEIEKHKRWLALKEEQRIRKNNDSLSSQPKMKTSIDEKINHINIEEQIIKKEIERKSINLFSLFFRKRKLSKPSQHKENIYERKGRIGEELIVSELSKLNVHHRILSNLYLPNGKGTTEVDVIMITYTGIYVIESKNYTGWVFGNENHENWTQSFPKSKFKFYNPIKQNMGHIRVLHSILRKNEIHNEDYPYVSYIIFGNDCELKSIDVHSAKVLNLRDINTKLKIDIANKANLFTMDQIDRIYNFLSQYANVSEHIKLKHKQYVRNIK